MGAVLAPAATCAVSATVAPTAPGALAAQLVLTNSSINSPIVVPLTAVRGAAGATANVSFSPRSVAFGTLHDGRASEVETVTISNAGGAVPLTIHTVAITGANAADYHIVKNNCPTDLAPADIAIDGSCTVDVAFAASAPGARSAALTITSNAPGASQAAALTGTGVATNPAISAAIDPRNGFPAYMQDGNANRVEPCLEATSNCVLLADAGFNPANPVVFPTNFPVEFFYSLAETQPVATPGCPAANVGAGAIIMRVAVEGSFANGTPIAGDQVTFGRVRVSGGGLCPTTPYTFVTPWGPTTVSTDATGGIKPNAGTTDTANALVFPMINGFPRWNPNVAPAAPVGYLGDHAIAHKITGGTYVPAGASGVDNAFTIKDSAGNQIARTENFLVSGKLAGPLQGSTYAFDFGNANVGATTATRTVTITNVGAPTTISARALAGLNAADYVINGGTCTVGLALATDQTCTVLVAFRPTAVGTRAAQLRITPAAGADIVVTLTGVGVAVGTPAITA
ncbi:MAG: choice-of-anchor D domain-containing protein, partial [Actinomycetota bacterium]